MMPRSDQDRSRATCLMGLVVCNNLVELRDLIQLLLTAFRRMTAIRVHAIFGGSSAIPINEQIYKYRHVFVENNQAYFHYVHTRERLTTDDANFHQSPYMRRDA